MKFKIRIDRERDDNIIFSVFADGKICGKLCMMTGETEEFIAAVQSGCDANGLFFTIEREK